MSVARAASVDDKSLLSIVKNYLYSTNGTTFWDLVKRYEEEKTNSTIGNQTEFLDFIASLDDRRKHQVLFSQELMLLGYMEYERETGAHQSLIEQAAKSGCAEAYTFLGIKMAHDNHVNLSQDVLIQDGLITTMNQLKIKYTGSVVRTDNYSDCVGYFLRGAELQDAHAYYCLGLYYLSNTESFDVHKSQYYFRKATHLKAGNENSDYEIMLASIKELATAAFYDERVNDKKLSTFLRAITLSGKNILPYFKKEMNLTTENKAAMYRRLNEIGLVDGDNPTMIREPLIALYKQAEEASITKLFFDSFKVRYDCAVGLNDREKLFKLSATNQKRFLQLINDESDECLQGLNIKELTQPILASRKQSLMNSYNIILNALSFTFPTPIQHIILDYYTVDKPEKAEPSIQHPSRNDNSDSIQHENTTSESSSAAYIR